MKTAGAIDEGKKKKMYLIDNAPPPAKQMHIPYRLLRAAQFPNGYLPAGRLREGTNSLAADDAIDVG